uniref:Uncharacterized protein n=1 Tax=Mycena chlorophos TaxID=658473 RepID=A0ABQ0M2U8_MYCCL|nr:predicted protein [Mycena chlorophos]
MSLIKDTIEAPTYASISAPILRASQVADLQPTQPSFTTTSPATRPPFSRRDLEFLITTALFALGVLLLIAGSSYYVWRRRRRNRKRRTRDLDEMSWTVGVKCVDELASSSPPPPSQLSLPPAPPSNEFSKIMEQFEQRLQQEEMDIACALDIAFNDHQFCAPFFAPRLQDDENDATTTMLALQAAMHSVGKRPTVRNRARQGSDASTSTQDTTVTLERFQGSDTSSATSMSSGLSEIDEEEEIVVYEVKQARTESMEMEKGRLLSWAPVTLLVTEPSAGTLDTTPSIVDDLLDAFPQVPVM